MQLEEAAVSRRVDDLHARYRHGFAGKPRVTRHLPELDEIIELGEALLAEVLPSLGSSSEAIGQLQANLQVYRQERIAVAEAQKMGPVAVRGAQLGSRANAIFGMYRRHYAGQNRATRDRFLLQDLIGALEDILKELHQVSPGDASGTAAAQIPPIEGNLDIYRKELAQIIEIQDTAGPDDQTGIYAAVANAQFDIYRTHFAGQARVSRRQALLERVVTALEWCSDGMERLIAAGDQLETNMGNHTIVVERLATYHPEVEAIQNARLNASFFDVIDALGQGANAISADYGKNFAGQNRATRDLDLLAQLQDRLLEIERQMWALSRVQDNPTNQANLGIVHDTLALYANEAEEIRKAQSH